PQRCDVILFHPPSSAPVPVSPQTLYVKRVVALPGEQITFTAEGVQGPAAQCDRYMKAAIPGEPPIYNPSLRVTLAAQEYFVLGDNRGNSLDSRDFGAVARSAIIGYIAATSRAAAAQDGADRVHDRAQIAAPGASARLGGWQQRAQQRPFAVGEVGSIEGQ